MLLSYAAEFLFLNQIKPNKPLANNQTAAGMGTGVAATGLTASQLTYPLKKVSGMKAHIGVDSKTKLIHSVVVTPAIDYLCLFG